MPPKARCPRRYPILIKLVGYPLRRPAMLTKFHDATDDFLFALCSYGKVTPPSEPNRESFACDLNSSHFSDCLCRRPQRTFRG